PHKATLEHLTCLTEVSLWNYPRGQNPDRDEEISRFQQRFFLVAGSMGGQLLSLDTVREGRQMTIGQAHSTQVVALKFDPLNMQLVSVGKDKNFKIWALSPHKSKQHPSSSSSTSLPCPSPISATLLFALNAHCYTTDIGMFALDPWHRMMAIAHSGGITSYTYDMESCIQPRELGGAGYNGKVTDIAYLPAYDIWASASTDGTVKIWDANAHLLREILFNQPIAAVCFANSRGDLLIALRDQIAVVRIQDYLPPQLLKHALSLDFDDDEVEIPFMFDSTINCWEYFFGPEEHLDAPSETKQPEETHHKLKILVSGNSKARKKQKNRHVFFRAERFCFHYERRLKEIYKGLVLPREIDPPPPELEPKLDDPMQIEGADPNTTVEEDSAERGDPDNVLSNRISSEVALLPVQVLRPDSPSEVKAVEEPVIEVETVISRGMSSEVRWTGNFMKPPSKTRNTRALSISQHEVTPEEQAQQMKMLKAVQPPPRPKPKKAKDETKQQAAVKQYLKKGVPLPNSAFSKKDDAAKLLKQQQDAQQAVDQRLFMRRNANANKKPVHSQLTMKIEELVDLEDLESSTPTLEEEPPQPLVNNEVPPPPIEQPVSVAPPEPPPVVVERVQPEERPISPPKPKNPVETKKPPPSPPPLRTSSAKKQADSPPPPSPPPVRQTVNIPSPARFTPKPKDEPPPPKPERRSPSPPKPPQQIWSLKPHAVELRRPGLKWRPKPPEAKKQEESEPEIRVVEEPQTKGEEFKFRLVTRVNSLVAEKHSWTLIRHRDDSFVQRAWRQFLGVVWFPGIKGVLNLQNLVATLFDVLRNGQVKEKCQASLSLLYLYSVFQSDFLDPMQSLIYPQLERMMHDEDWQVRAQLCSHILAYGIYHSDIVASLICRLADSKEEVRRIALLALNHLGIRTKESLKHAMIQVGILPKTSEVEKSSIALDDLVLASIQRHRQHSTPPAQPADVFETIKSWMKDTAVPPRPHPRFRPSKKTLLNLRRDSYFEHLAGPFFPPDAPKGSHLSAATTKSKSNQKPSLWANQPPDRHANPVAAAAELDTTAFDIIQMGWGSRPQSAAALHNPSSQLIYIQNQQRYASGPADPIRPSQVVRTTTDTMMGVPPLPPPLKISSNLPRVTAHQKSRPATSKWKSKGSACGGGTTMAAIAMKMARPMSSARTNALRGQSFARADLGSAANVGVFQRPKSAVTTLSGGGLDHMEYKAAKMRRAASAPGARGKKPNT
ncbi:hypothetical protein HK102_000286, partial [Quaeritorhiza haematococci]